MRAQASPSEPKQAGKLTITAQPSERAEILRRLAQLSERADIAKPRPNSAQLSQIWPGLALFPFALGSQYYELN